MRELAVVKEEEQSLLYVYSTNLNRHVFYFL